MKRDLTEDESKRIAVAILAGDRVQATLLYLSIAECGLTEAQEFIERLTVELSESKAGKFARKSRRMTE